MVTPAKSTPQSIPWIASIISLMTSGAVSVFGAVKIRAEIFVPGICEEKIAAAVVHHPFRLPDTGSSASGGHAGSRAVSFWNRIVDRFRPLPDFRIGVAQQNA